MFSWSNNNNNSSTSRTNSTYPGRRGAAATLIQGSIRPPSSSSQQQHTRKQHLTSYIEDPTLQRSTRRVSSDDTTYDTVFQTTSGDTLILRVNIPLGSSFATSCPVMTLAGVKVRHPWISTTSSAMRVTGYGPIQSEKAWKDSNLLLGSAVHDVVKHFQLNPPQMIEITDKGLQSIQTNTNRKTTGGNKNDRNNKMQTTGTPPRSGNSISTNGSGFHDDDDDAPPSYNVVAESTAAPDVPMPRVPLNFSETGNMSREELDELLCYELDFKSFVHRLKLYNEIFAIGSTRLNENAVLANENLKQGTKWKTLRNEVNDLHDTLKTKLDVYMKLEDEQTKICAPPDIQSTLRKLHKAKKEAFEESEQSAEEWVEDAGGGNVDDFCQRFLEQRKIHHMRAAKMEILQHNKIF